MSNAFKKIKTGLEQAIDYARGNHPKKTDTLTYITRLDP